MQLTKKLEENRTALQNALRDCGDVVWREFSVGGNGRILMLYADNFVDLEAIRESILETVMLDYQNKKQEGILEALLMNAVAVSEVKKIEKLSHLISTNIFSSVGYMIYFTWLFSTTGNPLFTYSALLLLFLFSTI